MSRYLILVLVNLPLIILAISGVVVDYKMGKISRKRFLFQASIWITILLALISTKFIYEFLFNNHLTQTEPLSLFDVIQITGIIIILFVANRSRIKLEALERRVQDLHQELSIKLSEKDKE